MAVLVLSLGSNMGDRDGVILDAIAWLGNHLKNLKVSEIYETPCANRTGKLYKNAVATGEYEGDPDKLNLLLKKKERNAGRTEILRERGDVPLDIDIVIEDGKILKEWDFRQKFFQIGYSAINI